MRVYVDSFTFLSKVLLLKFPIPTLKANETIAEKLFAVTFDFTSASNFVDGDILAISVTPEAAVFDLVWTAVFEYRGV